MDLYFPCYFHIYNTMSHINNDEFSTMTEASTMLEKAITGEKIKATRRGDQTKVNLDSLEKKLYHCACSRAIWIKNNKTSFVCKVIFEQDIWNNVLWPNRNKVKKFGHNIEHLAETKHISPKTSHVRGVQTPVLETCCPACLRYFPP